jgi:glycosyltransferase involved in cell wall biosynthesis
MVRGQFSNTGVISLDPLITYTKRHVPTPIGLVGACPELFRDRPSLNLVALCWRLFPSDRAEIVAALAQVRSDTPMARIVVLANDDVEVCQLSAAGIPAFVASSAMFTDETIFRPQPPFETEALSFDAIYNARFSPYKRHELASRVDNLALIYDNEFDGSTSPHEARVRHLLPHARYLNHEAGDGGGYVALSKPQVAKALNQARCGLCLSETEGYMRASMEYLLSGLPVVTTPSHGGRDRYFQSPFVIVAEDDPDAVRQAVAEIGKRGLSKVAVRDHVGRIVEFERRNFLRVFNTLIEETFGRSHAWEDTRALIDAHPFTEPHKAWSRQRLMPVAEALGVRLAPRPMSLAG